MSGQGIPAAPAEARSRVTCRYGRFRYGRFNWGARNYGIWDIWRADVREVIYQRLVNIPAKIIWKSYSPTHFGGATGTFTNVRLPPPCVSVRRSAGMRPGQCRSGGACGCCCVTMKFRAAG